MSESLLTTFDNISQHLTTFLDLSRPWLVGSALLPGVQSGNGGGLWRQHSQDLDKTSDVRRSRVYPFDKILVISKVLEVANRSIEFKLFSFSLYLDLERPLTTKTLGYFKGFSESKLHSYIKYVASWSWRERRSCIALHSSGWGRPIREWSPPCYQKGTPQDQGVFALH